MERSLSVSRKRALSSVCRFVCASMAVTVLLGVAHTRADLRPSTFLPRVHTIVVGNTDPYYSPHELTVNVGDVVLWRTAKPSDTHSIRETTGRFSSPDMPPGEEWCVTFPREGEYRYVCRFHPWMRGTIVVRAPVLRSSQLRVASGFDRISVNPSDGRLWLISRGKAVNMQTATDGPSVVVVPDSGNRRALWHFDRAGHLWGIDASASKLMDFEPASGRMRLHPDRSTRLNASAVAIGPNGTVWYYDVIAKAFVSVSAPNGGPTSLRPVALKSPPLEMTVTADDRIWFIESGRTAVGRYDLRNNQLHEYPAEAGGFLDGIATSDTNQAWATDAGRHKLLAFRDDWTTEYTLPTADSSPRGIVVDDEGTVWFAEHDAGKLGQLRAGVIREHVIGYTGFAPEDLAVDRDGNLWMADSSSGMISRVSSDTRRDLNAKLESAADACSPANANKGALR